MKRISVILLTALLLLALAGCGTKAPGSTPPDTTNPVVTVSPDSSPIGDQDAGNKTVTVFTKKREWDWDAIEKAYENSHPDVDLIVDITDASTYYDILKGYLSSGDLPDVIQTVPGPTLDLWMEHLVPLNDLSVLDSMQQDVLNEYLINGDYYGVPIFMELHGVVYNMNYLEQVGYISAPETLDEFIDLNQKLIAAGLPTGICPWSSGGSILGHMTASVFSIHDDPIAYMKAIQNGEVDLIEDPDWNALYDYLDATLEYGNEDALVTDSTTERNALYAEQYAWYAHDGSWLTPQIKSTNPDLEDHIQLGVYPFTNDASKNKIGRSTQSVSVMNTEHAEEAKGFVDWLLGSDEGCDVLAKVCNVVLLRSDYEMSEEDIGALGKQGVDYVELGRSYGNFRNFPESIQADLMTAIEKYLGNVVDREESLSEIQALFESSK